AMPPAVPRADGPEPSALTSVEAVEESAVASAVTEVSGAPNGVPLGTGPQQTELQPPQEPEPEDRWAFTMPNGSAGVAAALAPWASPWGSSWCAGPP
ncbi:unnamed protein product, partial [Polarella glacialis]